MTRFLATLALLLCSLSAAAQNCIPSGVTTAYTYFVAVDSSDLVARETGLSSFTVRRSRNGGASAAFTTPTINETDSSNMPGVYELLLDEDMTIDSGDDVQHMALHITHAGMAAVTKEICIARAKITAGETVAASGGAVTNVTTTATATNLTNAPTNGDFTATMKASGATYVGTALATYGPPTRAEATADKAEIQSMIGRITTITVTDQDTFVLAAGATFDDAYNGWGVKINDAGSQDEWLGKVRDYVGSSKTVELARASGFTIQTGDTVTLLPAFLDTPVDTALVNCTVNTANFAGDANELACILTDKEGGAVTVADGDLTGLELRVLSGTQAYEGRFIESTDWDGSNSELRITLSRALPGTLADGVIAIIR